MHRPKRKRRKRPPNRFRRAFAERLESRRVLATFTVDLTTDTTGGTCAADNPAGNVDCTLRSAIAAADANPGADTIEITPGNYLIDSALGPLTLNQTQDLTFIGTGATPGDVVVDGQSQGQLFNAVALGSPHTVRFENLTIQNGFTAQSGGAGIFANTETSLQLSSVVMQNNVASDANPIGLPNNGGAIEALGGIDVESSQFLNNVGSGDGGAISVQANDAASVSSIRNSVFTNNQAGNLNGAGFGGGVFVRGMADLTLENTDFGNNTAGDSAGGVYFEGQQLVVSGANFNGNRALGPVSGGGGLYVNTSTGFQINGGLYENNTAVDGAGGFEAINTPGVVSGATFRLNQVTGDGAGFDSGGGAIAILNTNTTAAVVSLESITVDQNTAPNAGGIATVNADVEIINSLIIANQATRAITGSAGGIGAFNSFVFNPLDISGTEVSGNVAVAQAGGIGSIDSPVFINDSEVFQNAAATGAGGGIGIISNNTDATLIASSVTIANNQSGADGGGIAIQGGGFRLINATVTANTASAAGGGLALESTSPSVVPTISFSTFADNNAVTGSNISATGSAVNVDASIFSGGDGSGTFVSQGFNIDSGTSMGFNQAGDQENTDPQLAPLVNNGGTVRTMAFESTSPAVDAVTSPINPPDTDARGELRGRDGNGDGQSFSDVGAFELEELVSPTLTIADVTVNEADSTATLTVTLDSDAMPFSVPVTTTDQSATAGSDYTSTTATLNFAGAGGESQTFTVPILNDAITENDETFLVSMGAASFGNVNTGDTAIVSIISEDTSALTVADVTVNETDGTATVAVVLDNEFEGAFSVPVTTADGTAIAGSDYTTTTATLNFVGTAGETQTFTVPILDDAITENDERFSVSLGAASDVLIGTADTASVLIVSEDTSALTVADVTVNETDGTATIAVTLDNEFEGAFTVPATTVDVTAIAGSDYTTTNATLNFAGTAGETQTFTVPILDDAITENDESFTVSLGDASDSLIGTNDTATVSIVSEDTSALTIADVTVNETDGTATIAVVLDNEFEGAFTVPVATADGTAIAGNDYTATTATLNFAGAAGETQTFSVPILDDMITENIERFTVGLGAASDALIGTTDTATVSIVSEDISAIMVADVTVNETDGTATVAVALDNEFEGAFTVQATTTDDTAIAGNDYTATTITLNFAGTAGETQTFTVPILDDAITENVESFGISVGSASDALIATDDTATVSIVSEDTSALTIADVSVNETDGTATIAVVLDNEFEGAFTVPAATVDGTAIAGNDYTTTNATLNFVGTAGETQTFTVPILDDAITENDESFTVSLGAASDALIGTTDTATVTIASEDTSALTVADVTVNETDGTATIAVVLDNEFEGAFTVPATTADGTAIAGNDYTTTNATLNFAGTAGETQTFTIPILNDAITENDESFTVSLGAASDALIGTTDTASVSIVSEDTSTLTMADVSISEDQDGVAVRVVLDNAFEGPFTVPIATSDGTALAGLDYTANAGTLSFTGVAGESQLFVIPIRDDSITENDETFTVSLGAASDALVGTADTATVTIESEDTSSLTIADVSVNEAAGSATIAVVLDTAFEAAFTVPVMTVDGSALAGEDYTGTNTTLNFAGAAGETQTFTIPILEDTFNEGDETFSVVLGTASDALINVSDTGQVTVIDNDTSSLSIADVTVNETDATATISVRLGSDAPEPFTVPVMTVDGTALGGSDFTSTNTTLSFAGDAGEIRSFDVPILDDAVTENDESFTIALGVASNPSIGTSDTAVVTIVSDDTSALTVADVTIDEDAGQASVVVVLDNAFEGAFTVPAMTVDGTAVAGVDYTARATTLNFAGNAGESQTLLIPILDDAVTENDKLFNVTLGAASDPLIDTSDSAVVTVVSEDVSSLTIADVTVNETDGTATLTVSLDNTFEGTFTVPVATSDGSAIDGDDYTATNTTLNFAGMAGETQTFTIPILDDAITENDETFRVQLGTASDVLIGTNDTADVTILSEDASALTIADVAVNETDGTATVTVLLDNAFEGTFDATVTTSDATATAGNDYTSTTATLTFAGAAGESQAFVIPVLDDLFTENDETFTVSLTGASDALIEISDTGSVTIASDDVSALTIADVTVNEGAGTASVAVVLDNAFEGPFSVPVATTDAAAVAGEDYTATNVTLNFAGAAGESQTFEIPILDDLVNEPGEAFTVVLAAASDPLIGVNDTGAVTIADDDPATLTIADITVNEFDGSVTVSVTLDTAVATAFTVPVMTADGTASAGDDYTAVSTTLNFAGNAGETQSFVVPIIDDVIVEPSETFSVTMGAASVATVDTSGTGTVSIFSDDGLVLSIGDVSVNETDGSANVSVRLNRATPGSFTVDVSTTDATATAGEDYTATSTTLNFAGTAGEIQTIVIPILDDGATELPEAFTVSMSGVSNPSVVATDTATVTIASEDVSVLTIADVTVDEDVGTAVVAITLDQAVPADFVVEATTTAIDPAEAPGDFTQTTTLLSFTAGGPLSQSFLIPITDDVVSEIDEQIRVSLQKASVAFVDATDTALVTIVDNDLAADLTTTTVLASGDPNPLVEDTVRFTTTVSNQGPSDATGISLVNVLPAGLTPTANHGSVSQGNYDAATGSWTIGVLAANSSVTLIVEGVVNLDQGGATITNMVTTATGDQTDPTTAGDVLSASVNVTPVVVAVNDSFAFDEDADPQTLDVLVNDSPTGLTITSVDTAGRGTAAIGPGGTSITYVADDDEFGTDVFEYTVQENRGQSSTAEITITINPVNDPPVFGEDTVDVRTGGDFTIDATGLLANDVPGPANESNQNLLISSVVGMSAQGATVTLVGGDIQVVPDVNFVGLTDTIEYTVSDDAGGSATATVDLNFLQNLSGHIFCDRNVNGVEDPGEEVAGTRVFLDDNQNGVFDPGELSTFSNVDGDYRFVNAPLGPASIIAEVPSGCRTLPANPGVSQATFDVGNLARSITATDRDGDGDQDLLVAVDLDDALIVLENRSGQIASKEVLSVGVRPQAVAAGPSDDGVRPMIAVAGIGQSEDGGGVFLGNETFQEIEAGNGPVDLVLEDLDGDGDLELITVAFRSSTLLINPLDGGDSIELVTNSEQIYTIDTGDVDGDDDHDIIVAGLGYGTGSEVSVLLNHGDLMFSDPITVGAMQSIADEYVDVAIADLTDDGSGEVITLDQNGKLRTFLFNGRDFDSIRTFEVPGGASQMALGDFNADEIPDVAVASLTDETVDLLVGRGDGTFESIKQIGNIRTPVDLEVVDLEGDGFAEIAVLNHYGDHGGADLGLPSLVTILQLDVDAQAVTIEVTDSTLDFTFPGIDPAARVDVDSNGEVTPSDALRVINALATQNAGEGEAVATVRSATDVNLDGITSPIDALLVINHLARLGNAEAEAPAAIELDFLDDREEDDYAAAVDAVLTAELF